MNAMRAKVRADHRQGLVDCLKLLEDADSDTKEIIDDVVVALEEDIVLYRQLGQIINEKK